MRKILIALTLILLITFKINAQWEKMPSNVTADLNSVYFLDSLNGWSVGENGTIIKYDGTEWIEQESGTSQDLHSVFFIDSSCGYAVGDFGIFLKYDGSAWTKHVIDPSGRSYQWDINDIFMTKKDTGWAVSEIPLDRLRYTNSDWTIEQAQDNNQYQGGQNDIFMLGDTLGWCVGWNGTIYKYDNSIWKSETSGTGRGLNSVFLTSSTEGWIVGRQGTMLQYNGNRWIDKSLDSPFAINSVYFIDNYNGYAAMENGKVLIYNGEEWNIQQTSTYTMLNSIFVLNNGDGWIAGDNGTLLYNKLEFHENTPTQIKVPDYTNFETYPNPVSDILYLKNNNIQRVILYNTNGQIIKSTKIKGNTIDLTEIQSGSYLLKVIYKDDKFNVSKIIKL